MTLNSASAFLDRHPGLGLAILTAHYPLPADLIEAYVDEWDWEKLTGNPRLDWTDELLERYLLRWAIPELWTNPGVVWTAERIRRLIDRHVDDEWYYLSQNPSLPVDEVFLAKFAKKINWGFLSDNHGIPWTKALLDAHGDEQLSWAEGREQLLASALHTGNSAAEGWASSRLKDKQVARVRQQVAEGQRVARTVAAILEEPDLKRKDRLSAKPLAGWDEAWLAPLKEGIAWWKFSRNPHLPWSLDFLDHHAEFLEGDGLAQNPAIWPQVFASRLTEAEVRRFLAAQFPHKFLKYFDLKCDRRDKLGCLPDVGTTREMEAIALDRYWTSPKVIEFVHGTIMQGPPRFTDLVGWDSNGPPGQTLIVSERLAEALKSLSLPEHATYEARVRCHPKYQRKYGKEPHRYLVLHFLQDAFLKRLDLSRTQLCIWSYREERERVESFPPGSFATIEEAQAKCESVRRARPRDEVSLLPEALHPRNSLKERGDLNFASPLFPLSFHGDSDLLWMGYYPVVSETFRALVTAQGLTGMSFQIWGRDSIFQAEAETEASKIRKRRLLQQLSALAPTAQDPAAEVFRALEARRDAILTREDRVAEIQGREPAPTKARERQVQSVERKLDVQFPPLYRAAWTTPQPLPDRGEWDWLPLAEVFCIGDDWHQSRPESVRAVAVARNGLGDFLGFLLREDSMTQLADTLVEFKHESAQIESLPGRLQLKSPAKPMLTVKAKPQLTAKAKPKRKLTVKAKRPK